MRRGELGFVLLCILSDHQNEYYITQLSTILRTMRSSFLQHPLESLFQAPSHVSVLRVLYGLKEGVSGREVARRAGVSDRTSRLVLERLEAMNLVVFSGSGKIRLYRLNRGHFFVKSILEKVFSAESKFSSGILEELSVDLEKRCRWACIFGSTARAEDSQHSDLDLLILVDRKDEKVVIENSLQEWLAKYYQVYGLSLEPLVLTVSEWSRDSRYRSLKDDIKSSFITLVGKEPR